MTPFFASTGEARFSGTFPKQSKEWVAKKLFEPTTQVFREGLVEKVLERRMDKNVRFDDPDSKLKLPPMPANISRVPRPTTAELAQRLQSRFAVAGEEN